MVITNQISIFLVKPNLCCAYVKEQFQMVFRNFGLVVYPAGTMEGESSWRHLGNHLGGIWEASGRHLGGIWEAFGEAFGEAWLAEGSRRLQEAPRRKIDTPLQQNAKVILKCKLHYVFLRVGVTKYCKLQGTVLPGSFNGASAQSRPL